MHFLFLFFLIGKSLFSDVSHIRPIENRNLYLPNLFFIEPYPTTSQVVEKGKSYWTVAYSNSNMIDDNNALVDKSSYPKWKPFYNQKIAENAYEGQITPFTYYNTEYYYYGRLAEQQRVRIDAEVSRGSFKYAYGIRDKLELGVELTLLSYNTGILDKPITAYHRASGIPYPLRDIYPDNKMSFIMTDSTSTIINAKPRTGLGDSVVDLKWNLLAENSFIPSLSLVSLVKIPTGFRNYAMSSGKFDLGGGVVLQNSWKDFVFFLNGYISTANQSFNSDQIRTKSTVFHSSFTIGYKWTEKLFLLVQGEYKTSPYKTRIFPLYQEVVMLSFGFNYKVLDSCSVKFNLAEDPYFQSRVVPDITGQLAFTCSP